ncbi:thiazole tautomerase TenI [Bacillus salacetis]|uniref:Thiazole tautomerase TenI n=1 Tax=Bacillus salacetis TaxID=2315464 RepID=A0A3A1RAA3_9BACI|nr:thiamine phosphate synthase [Bacillus salacetis]RIW38321.1 thiazole tautomerase TenI [Bacillus salacetis]
MKKPVLHAITSGRKSIEETTAVSLGISPYVDAIQIREPGKTAREIYELAERMIESGIPAEKLILNNRLDAAVALGIERVHLGFHSLSLTAVKRSFPHLSAGMSVHSLSEAIGAVKGGSEYIVFGHIFQTESKRGKPSRGLAELAKIAESVSLPVMAVGGIQPHHVREVLQTGASGIAVMTGIFNAKDPIKAAIEYQTQMEMKSDEEHL